LKRRGEGEEGKVREEDPKVESMALTFSIEESILTKAYPRRHLTFLARELEHGNIQIERAEE